MTYKVDFSSIAPVISKLIPPIPSMPWTWGDGHSDNSPGDMSALVKAYAEAHAKKQADASGALPPPVAAPAPAPSGAGPASMLGLNMFNPVPQPQPNPGLPAWAQTGPLPQGSLPTPGGFNSIDAAAPDIRDQRDFNEIDAAAPAASHVPTPMARPADAPQAPAPMGFFQRNTAMMKDPMSGDYLDPQAAQKADASGPDLIQKFMNYFHQKDIT